MNIAVIGSRSGFTYYYVKTALDAMVTSRDTLISGGARGVDSYARRYARERHLKFIEITPNFSNGFDVFEYFKRNQRIAANCDIMISFWDGKSKGTLSTIKYAKKLGKEVIMA